MYLLVEVHPQECWIAVCDEKCIGGSMQKVGGGGGGVMQSADIVGLESGRAQAP